MVFVPIGGYPPVYLKDPGQVDNKSLESRGFTVTNIVNIGKIMDSKKKENLFLAFGTEDESDLEMGRVFLESPYQYDEIEYDDKVTKY